jgi:predicted RNase H-like nuclease (RuvC/YqgF family)
MAKSKPDVGSLKRHIAGLTEMNEQYRRTAARLQEQVTEMKRDYEEERARFTRELSSLSDHAIVLQGDRDRLTATIEVLSRRLASPYADRDAIRGGWRGANALHALDPINQYKAESRG